MKKTTNFDAFAQFADAQLSKEEMKNIKGGTEPTEFEGGNGSGGGGNGEVLVSEGTCWDVAGGRRVQTTIGSSGRRFLLATMANITSTSTANGATAGMQYINCVD